jgi:cytoskeletal protein CcmA (bactofilin family)
MIARKSHTDALGVIGSETIIGTGVVVHGTLTATSDISIDGTLEGSITTTGDLTIGMNAQIKANVSATNVTVAGTLHGDIAADGQASIKETGNVHGDIRSAGLAISPGGIFIGRSVMESPALPGNSNPLLSQGDTTGSVLDDHVDTLKPATKPRRPHD